MKIGNFKILSNYGILKLCNRQRSLITRDINVSTRRLRVVWGTEILQDISAYHNLDAERELTSILTEHLAAEINRDILNQIMQGINNLSNKKMVFGIINNKLLNGT